MNEKNSHDDRTAQQGSHNQPGKEIYPRGLPAEEAKATPAPQRAAPAPGLPITEEEYKKLREQAARGVAPRAKHSQHDPSEPPDERN